MKEVVVLLTCLQEVESYFIVVLVVEEFYFIVEQVEVGFLHFSSFLEVVF